MNIKTLNQSSTRSLGFKSDKLILQKMHSLTQQNWDPKQPNILFAKNENDASSVNNSHQHIDDTMSLSPYSLGVKTLTSKKELGGFESQTTITNNKSSAQNRARSLYSNIKR